MSDTSQSSYQAGLTYVDLLYAVPVADLATRVSETHLHMAASGWSDIALALIAITFGWIGHHTNRQKMPKAMADNRLRPQAPFAGAHFLQFIAEVAIIGAYFALGSRVKFHHAESASELWKAAWLVVVFSLYLIWDMLDIRIATRLRGEIEAKPTPPIGEDASSERIAARELRLWAMRAKAGKAVTFAFLLVFSVFIAVAVVDTHLVVAFDIAAVLCLYAYRRVQHFACSELYL
jgi:hypothetical protein